MLQGYAVVAIGSLDLTLGSANIFGESLTKGADRICIYPFVPEPHHLKECRRGFFCRGQICLLIHRLYHSLVVVSWYRDETKLSCETIPFSVFG